MKNEWLMRTKEQNKWLNLRFSHKISISSRKSNAIAVVRPAAVLHDFFPVEKPWMKQKKFLNDEQVMNFY